MYVQTECTIQKMDRKNEHIFHEYLIHSYRSFGESNKTFTESRKTLIQELKV
jgi:hypothetical protein